MSVSHVVVPVSDRSQVGEVRRRTNQLAAQAGLSESTCGKAALLATELATNLTRHAGDGEMVLTAVESDGRRSMDIMSIDRGPGIADVARALVDGYSTAGGPGNGLGAISRMASEWDLYSSSNPETGPQGTVLFARVNEDPVEEQRSFSWGAVCRPAPHETLCGDTWRVAQRPGEIALIIADGLGHGPEAAAAAQEAASVFERDPFAPLPVILQNAGIRMQGTRGGAVAATRINAAQRMLKFVGVGNIAAHLRDRNDGKGRGLTSHNGIVGGAIRRIQEFEYACSPGESLLVMHSDGLQSRWNLEAYAGLRARHPAVIAGVLYRDFTRGRDDVTVAVLRLSLT